MPSPEVRVEYSAVVEDVHDGHGVPGDMIVEQRTERSIVLLLLGHV